MYDLGPLLQDKEVLQVPLGQLSKWRVSKAQMAQLCPQDLAAAILGHACQPIEEEWTKANLTWQLHQAYEQHTVDATKLGFGIHPQELLTLQHVKKGQLKLVPLTTLAKAKAGDLTSHHLRRSDLDHFSIQAKHHLLQ